MKQTKKHLLKKRLLENFTAYRTEVLGYEPEKIFDLSDQISTAVDVITLMDMIDEEQATYLLQFENPLEVLADAWETYLRTNTEEDFCMVVYGLVEIYGLAEEQELLGYGLVENQEQEILVEEELDPNILMDLILRIHKELKETNCDKLGKREVCD